MTSPRVYSPGDAVFVVALKRRGQVVERRGRAYRVAVGGLSITCREDEMQRVEAPTAKRKAGPRPASGHGSGPGSGPGSATGSITGPGEARGNARGEAPGKARGKGRGQVPGQGPGGAPGRTPARSAPTPARGEETMSSIDLHGFTTLQVRDALLTHLDAALRAGHAIVDVVHGIGTGRVRATALAELQRLPVVKEIRRHPTNRGVTRVYL